jgi:hypothetical protein
MTVNASLPPRTTTRGVIPASFFVSAGQTSHASSGNFMDYIITATDSAGVLSLKRDSAAAAIKKAIELLGDGCRDVCITDPEGRIHGHADFDQLLAADKT